jgi:hypothetical protein
MLTFPKIWKILPAVRLDPPPHRLDLMLTEQTLLSGFLEKVKTGKAQAAGSGFGGKGLDRLDKEREARDKAERKAYGEDEKEEKAAEAAPEGAAPTNGTTTTTTTGGDILSNFKVEVKRGPAPDSSKGSLGVTGAALAARKLALAKEEEKLQKSIKEAEEAAARAGKDTPAYKQATTVIAKLNAQLRAQKFVLQSQIQAAENAPARPQVTGDVSEYHAVIPINDYPQKARWRVTNKETMVNLIEITGASVTNKGRSRLRSFICNQWLTIPSTGIYYESNKEPSSLEDPPKLHLLVESNEEWRVSCWFHPCKFVITHFVRIGRASCSGDQTPVVRSFCRRIAGGDAQSNRTGSLQRCIAASIPCALYDIRPSCILTLLAHNKYTCSMTDRTCSTH